MPLDKDTSSQIPCHSNLITSTGFQAQLSYHMYILEPVCIFCVQTTHHSFKIQYIQMTVVNTSTPIPPIQHCCVTIHHGEGEVRTGRGPHPSHWRRGPFPYTKQLTGQHFQDAFLQSHLNPNFCIRILFTRN